MAPKGPATGSFTLLEPTTMHFNSASSSADGFDGDYGGVAVEAERRGTPQIVQRPVDDAVHAGK
jgi:hypothetical protein